MTDRSRTAQRSRTVELGMPTVASDPHRHLRGTESFPAAAHRALADTGLRRNLGHATRTCLLYTSDAADE